MSFSEFPFRAPLFKAIEQAGFDAPTEVQQKAIPAILDGKDVMVSARTGSGKTAAFLLPMLQRMLEHDAPNTGTRALILAPTRELALQLQKVFEKLAAFTPIKCGLIIGGEPFKYQVATIRKNPEVLIATPGRLVEHIERNTPDLRDLEVLVLDEADRMLDLGFADDMQIIASAANDEKQTLLFSATFGHRGMKRIESLLQEPMAIGLDNHREGHDHIIQERILADDLRHKEKLLVALLEREEAQKTFVFCATRAQVQKISNLLNGTGLRVGFIHGEIPQSERKQVLNQFRDGKLQALVATDVAARGLDVDDVDLVINFTVAHNGDDHVHRVGRTGRAGKSGRAITLVDHTEWNLMESIVRYLKLKITTRKVKGLIGHYKGPQKKAKPKSKTKGKGPNNKGTKTKGKSTTRNPTKKPRPSTVSENGFAPLKRKKPSSD
ncbi:ATP-dependent RNA helicase SrmB [BD1-7 clade bacterium]|uniref:ATP-dependent RNA helicase SrmB n=1 Tax=BD1-7 clade bacterium TaxID=2029982 RepID=A0A5S9QQX2_9GAMM|nr:ATP-dependent RNA helicase SrmB [BD1-7 clade bacterium]CAA0121743.1 ATP-dependent RNA helicase SrmB [BD1-7 clade bacterium]